MLVVCEGVSSLSLSSSTLFSRSDHDEGRDPSDIVSGGRLDCRKVLARRISVRLACSASGGLETGTGLFVVWWWFSEIVSNDEGRRPRADDDDVGEASEEPQTLGLLLEC